MAIYKDFDKFLNELEKKEIKFKLFDREWYLPSELPVLIILKALKAKDNEEEAFKVIESLLGEEQFEELLQLGLTMSAMTELLNWVMFVYTGEIEKKQGQHNMGK